ncbi:MAG: nuclear transport factor 2 family protein [Acidobacteriota bacterium]|nr:nuclear transport factor 2 family protein [Acidobacteriota bacterium]
MKVTLLAAVLFVVSMFAGVEASRAQPAQEAHTAEAVMAADKGWGVAEEKGDVAYVDALLLPEYRSISPDGGVHDKAAILASTRKSTPERAAMIEKYLADHPTEMAVIIDGDTAVLTFTAIPDAKKPDAKRLIRSCDIFVYRNGHWRAIYSQHTDAEKA